MKAKSFEPRYKYIPPDRIEDDPVIDDGHGVHFPRGLSIALKKQLILDRLLRWWAFNQRDEVLTDGRNG